MNIRPLLNKIIKQRIVFVITGTTFLCLVLLLLFYSLFLILPALFVKSNLIAPLSLFIILIICLLIPAIIYTFRKPFFGKKFFDDIIQHPYTSNDIKSAIELESGRSYPRKENDEAGSSNDASVSGYLTDRFNSKILGYIKRERKLYAEIIPDFKRVAVCIVVIILAVLLSVIKSDLVFDVFSALKAGLPVELIALDTPIKFDNIEAVITPPAYLDPGTSTTSDLNAYGKIKVMQGSNILIRGKLKNIKSGSLILSAGKGVEYYTITINNNIFFEAAFLAPMKGAFALEFSFTETNPGKTSGKSKVYTIEALPDQPPTIKIFSPPQHYNVLFGNTLEINFAAADDYGILEVWLYHKNAELDNEHYKELVARFPKEPRTNYSASYAWNPVLREGDKINELVYDPETKTVEYFLEVKDINTFSGGGIARSDVRYVHFTDALSNLKDGIKLIQELIDDGKTLLRSPENKTLRDGYRKLLTKAVEVFSKELSETMPQSTLIQKTNDVLSSFYLDNTQKTKESLKSYIAYLERYIVFMQLMLQTERSASIDNAVSSMQDLNKDPGSYLKTIGREAELLEKEFRKDIEEIERLLRKGDRAGAQAKMKELLNKIQRRMSEELAGSMEQSQKVAGEVIEKVDKILKLASELLKKQEANIIITDKRNIKAASVKQKEINEGLLELNNRTEKLSSEYPFIMYALNSYSAAAKLYGERALDDLNKSDITMSSQDQSKVIQFLKNFMNASARQKQLMEELAKGNFENLMQRSMANRFVLIPKEAVYTIPIDYKNKIIEMSKDRSKLTEEKEGFWRDILE